MKKAPLYSSSRPLARNPASPAEPVAPADTAPAVILKKPTLRARLQAFAQRHTGPVWALGGALLVAAGMLLQHNIAGPRVDLTQEDIDEAVRTTLENEVMPSPYARAYEAVAGSVVRVVGLDDEKAQAETKAETPKVETPAEKVPAAGGR